MARPKIKITKAKLSKTLTSVSWNKSEAAKELGVHRSTLRDMIAQAGLKQPKTHRSRLIDMPAEEWLSLLEGHGWNRTSVAAQIGCYRATVSKAMKQHGIQPPEVVPEDEPPPEPVVEGSVDVETKYEKRAKPRKGKVKRYILTCAQNNTSVHEAVLDNLHVLADHYDAEMLISRFTYNKARYGKKSVKPGTLSGSDTDDSLWYAPQIEAHVCDHRVELAPGLVFCGEMNILPTAVRPLSGFDSYTGRSSAIFPHPKVALASIATAKNQGTKFNYTTGTITQRNYIQKKSGLKAQFHHVYGGLLVEVDHKGRWWVRQLNASDDGELWDLDVRVDAKGTLTTGNRIEGVTWGDIHEAFLDPTTDQLAFGEKGVLDALRPYTQFFHDVLDFRSRMHHEMKDSHGMFWKHSHSYEDSRKEVAATAEFLKRTQRSWCKSVVCDSNHDNMLTRWLREGDYREDHVNAIFFLECQLRVYRALRESYDRDYHLLEDLCYEAGLSKEVKFLREDESFILCPEKGDGIECGMHGHRGIDGSRGTPAQYARMGRRANTGHTHRAGIHDGVYTSGLLGLLNMIYNVGPSSWSHSIILTYPNGKRTIVTFWDRHWAAGRGLD